MTAVLCTIFFLSGAAALIFETLWFRQAGLTFGNGVWAAALVMAGFMAGLALGNAGVARIGARIRRPVRFYALLEGLIAVTGVALVWWLPSLTPLLTPLLRPLLDQPWLVNLLRLAVGFLLLLIPSTAMGATLPLLVKALLARDPNFGSVLGRLYGWNTLGAVVGALAGEVALLEWLGVRGSALVAASINLSVACIAAALSGRFIPGAVLPGPQVRPRISPDARRLLAGAFLAGGALLALEVIWFRFLQLFVHASSLVFSIMLAVVLAGIAAGSLVAGAVLRRHPDAFRHLSWVACGSGVLVCGLYYGFSYYPFPEQYIQGWKTVLAQAALLMFPVSLLSGSIFAMIGAALHRELGPPTRTAGLLTFTNTVGSGLGSLAAGFLLLPLLGIERSFWLLAASYGMVAWLLRVARPAEATALPRLLLLPAALLLAALLAFPFGLMEREYIARTARRYGSSEQDIAAVREGRSETILYLRRSLLDETLYYRMVTNGHSMSGTSMVSRRYMKLYVYWPVALHPDPRRALLISYGLGNTARALADTRSLEHIDVVELSREVLEMSDIVFPDPSSHPLRDPRVRTHVEDGRYFLETREERYDLITGEPPPPKNAGIVNLYTREYFQLVYDRLAEGGIHTYWLPVHNLTMSDSGAIVRAYCQVFRDCSLWSGAGMDWMLVGTRGARWMRSEVHFRQQWEDPLVAPELHALGFELPEQLGALFIADADQLREFTGGSPPLVDDFPKRLENQVPFPPEVWPAYASWTEPDGMRERFRASTFIREAWPEELRERTLAWFDIEGVFNSWAVGQIAERDLRERMKDLHTVLTETSLRSLPLFLLGTSPDQLQLVHRLSPERQRSPRAQHLLGLEALGERDYERAVLLMRRAHGRRPKAVQMLRHRLYALCLAGRMEEAEGAVRRALEWLPLDGQDRGYWSWMSETFGLIDPYAVTR